MKKLSFSFSVFKLPKSSLQFRLIVQVSVILIFGLSLLTFGSLKTLNDAMVQQLGTRALLDAIEIAKMPLTISSIELKTIDKLRPVMNEIRERMQATNITLYLTDNQIIHFFEKDQLNHQVEMVSWSEQQLLKVLARDAFIDIVEINNELVIQGFSPIHNASGDLLGVVGTQVSQDDLQLILNKYDDDVFLIFLVSLIGCGAYVHKIAKDLKKSIFGLEPEQIAHMYQERVSVLNGVKEGIVSIDSTGQIMDVNNAAGEILKIKPHKMLHKNLREYVDAQLVNSFIKSQETIEHYPITLNNEPLLVNVIPIEFRHEKFGFILSFRPFDEIAFLNRELDRNSKYADMLRTQTHEYSNKLHTLWGLLQSGHIEEACQMISKESEGSQQLITFLVATVPDPVLSGLFLGKYNRARELGLDLHFDSESSMRDIPKHLDRHSLVTVLGNIIDNALEATLNFTGKGGVVSISMIDIGKELIFEIEDMGGGMEDFTLDKIYQKGFSTKAGSANGYGMHLVKNALRQLHSSLDIQSKPQCSTLISLFIPKEVRNV